MVQDTTATLHNLKQRSVGAVRSRVLEATATATITLTGNDTIVLNKGDADIVVTIATTPEPGDYLEIIGLDINGGGSGHTVVLPSGVTWDGTNDTLTFDADGEHVVCRAVDTNRWVIVSNPASVEGS